MDNRVAMKDKRRSYWEDKVKKVDEEPIALHFILECKAMCA
jgi:hypothetical protein